MILWRISNYQDLSGKGGIIAGARWHNAGRPVVYTASSPASALLEILVNLELADVQDLPVSYTLLEIEVPDSLPIPELSEVDLGNQWKNETARTRAIGDGWLASASSALLSIPSAIVPFTQNYLINPMHSDSQRIRILSAGPYPHEPRLLRKKC
ncbi:MAG: RES family NAD+ phosphorylase [Sulfurimicrobium sp.]|nr:RES family NAD+ phosphorylase [Sulfurimicrobium sp.]